MSDEVPNHVSALRYFVAKTTGVEHRAVETLAQAQSENDFAAIFEGDFGGQIYVTCPIGKIGCDEQTLRQLLLDIDGLAWEHADGCGLYFEHAPNGATVGGGMGGGAVAADVWVHPELYELGLAEAIAEVIHGERDELGIPSADEMERQAHQGDAHAQFLLSRKMRSVNPARSLELLRASAEQANLSAMYLMTKANIPRAEKERWLVEIANRSDNDCRIDAVRSQLAEAYVKGGFGKQDHTAAAALCHQTCARLWSAGDAFLLGKLYREGLGVQQDNINALMSLILSASFESRDYPSWKNVIGADMRPYVLDAIQKLKACVSSSEIIEAERLARLHFHPTTESSQ